MNTLKEFREMINIKTIALSESMTRFLSANRYINRLISNLNII